MRLLAGFLSPPSREANSAGSDTVLEILMLSFIMVATLLSRSRVALALLIPQQIQQITINYSVY